MKEFIEKIGKKSQAFFDWWKDYLNVIFLSITRILRDNVNILASGLVYSTLIAVIPCIAFLFAFLSVFGVLQTAIDMLTEFLVDTLGEATGNQISTTLQTFTGNALSLGVFGVISFLITAVFLVNKIYIVVNGIFRTQPSSGTIKRFSTFISVLFIIALVIVFIISMQGRIERILENLILGSRFYSGSNPFWESLLMIAMVWFVIFSLVYFIPNAKVRFRSASVGASSGLVAILIATEIFKYMISKSVNYSVIYGSLATLLFVLIYFYIFWYIIMVAAEITYVHQFRPDKGQIKGRADSPLSQISEGVNLVLIVADKYRKGDGSTTDKELSRRLTIPLSKLYSYINCLEDGGIIMSVNNQGTSFVPARPLDKIYLKELLHILYGSERKSKEDIHTMGEAVADELEAVGIKGLEDISLENLMERL